MLCLRPRLYEPQLICSPLNLLSTYYYYNNKKKSEQHVWKSCQEKASLGRLDLCRPWWQGQVWIKCVAAGKHLRHAGLKDWICTPTPWDFWNNVQLLTMVMERSESGSPHHGMSRFVGSERWRFGLVMWPQEIAITASTSKYSTVQRCHLSHSYMHPGNDPKHTSKSGQNGSKEKREKSRWCTGPVEAQTSASFNYCAGTLKLLCINECSQTSINWSSKSLHNSARDWPCYRENNLQYVDFTLFPNCTKQLIDS